MTENIILNNKTYILNSKHTLKENAEEVGKVLIYTKGQTKEKVKDLNIGFNVTYNSPDQISSINNFVLRDKTSNIPESIIYDKRDVVSMQFFTKIKDLSVCIIIIMNEHEKIKFETILKEIIYCLKGLNVVIKDNFNPTLITHFGIYDFLSVKDCNNNILYDTKYTVHRKGKKIYTLNGKYIKINPYSTKPNVITLSDQETIKVYPRIKDVTTLIKSTSLLTLGNSINIPQKSITDKELRNMRNLYNGNQQRYIEYTLTNTKIIYEWVTSTFGNNIPSTISSYSEQNAIKELCKENNWYKDIIENNQTWKDAFNSAKYSYKGGYNQSFVHGIYFNKTYDLDISGTYPLVMSMLKDINWKKEPLKVKNTKATLKMFKPDEYGFGKAKVVYNDNIKFPATAKKEYRGLIFAKEGEDYYTNPEIWYALKHGAYVYLKEYYFLTSKEEKPMADLIHTLSVKRNRLKDDPVKYELQTLINNSLSGKMGQGLNDENNVKESVLTNAFYASHMTALVRVFLSIIMELITNTKVKETGNKRLIKKHTGVVIENKEVNGVVFGVTTDGIITNITNFDLNKLIKDNKSNEIINMFLTAKEELGNKVKLDLRERIKKETNKDKIKELEKEERSIYNIFKQKHQQDILINIKNRVNIGLNLDNSGQGVLAVSGYPIPCEVRKIKDESMNNLIAHMYLNRNIKSFYNKYPSKRKFIQETRLDVVSDNTYWEYDFKGQPYNFKEVSFKLPVINSKGRITVYKTYTICNYEIKPWKNINEFTDIRNFVDEKRPTLKTKEDLDNFLFLYEGCYKNDVKITGTVNEVKAKQILRLTSKGILKPRKKKTGKDVLREVELYYNVKLNYNTDWCKGKQYSTIKDLSVIEDDIRELNLIKS